MTNYEATAIKLENLDKRGGLGYEAHDVIREAAAAIRELCANDLRTAKQLESCHDSIAELQAENERMSNDLIGAELDKKSLQKTISELQLRWRRKAVAYDYLYHAVLYSTTLTESNGHKSYEDIVEEINAMLANGQFKEEVQIDDGFAESYILVELDEFAEKDAQIYELQAKLEAENAKTGRAESAIEHLSTFATSNTDVNILYLNGDNPFLIEVTHESGSVRFKGNGKSLLDAIEALAALEGE